MIAPFAPIRVSVEFALTDGNQVARASFDCPVGHLPSAEDIETAAKSILTQVQAQLGEEFWWQTRHGFVSDEMYERTGASFSVPGPDAWEAGWAA